jgi:hypothetical protein
MKIRNGFVSNSSSSSFLIISKNGKLTKDMLMKSFGVEKGAVLYKFAEDMAKEMIDSSEEYTIEKYKKNYGWEDMTDEEFKEQYPDKYELLKEVEKNGWKIYEGSADSYEQAALCSLEINYEDENVKIEKDADY